MKKPVRNLLILLVLFALLSPKLYTVAKGFLREQLYDFRGHTQAEETVMAYARETGIPYGSWPESLIDLLDRNPETLDYVLSYPRRESSVQKADLRDCLGSDTVPLFLQWDKRWGYLQYGNDMAGLTGCGPTCLSMAAFYLTQDANMSPDNMIRFALEEGYCSPGNGSSWTLISEGASKLGLTADELPLVKKLVFSHLEAGHPVICVMGPGDFTATGHYIVLTGLEDGLLRVNDPNSRQRSEQLWDFDAISGQIRNLWAIRRA